MLDFPNLTANKECNQIMHKYLELMVQNLIQNLGKSKIKSIILTGSLARGEGTARIVNEKIEIYSDFDLNIVTNLSNHLIFNRILKSLSNNYTKYFQKKGLLTHVNIIPITESQIEKINTIRRVECISTDKIIWGKDILSNKKSLPRFINKLDAIELLFNRIIDLLRVQQINNNNLKIYLICKVILDLNTSVLAFLGDYTPYYTERMKFLATKKCLDWIPDLNYSSLIRIFTNFKLNCDFDELVSAYRNLFQIKNYPKNKIILHLIKNVVRYLTEIMKKEFCSLYSHENCENLQDLFLLRLYLNCNSKFFKGLLLKLNVFLLNPLNIKKNNKILLLKSHPKFYFHFILYCLLQSKYSSSTTNKGYITEAYNKIKDVFDISSVKNWNSIIEIFLKSQKIVLQRFFG